jgi:PAS domain S-box-containing protein
MLTSWTGKSAASEEPGENSKRRAKNYEDKNPDPREMNKMRGRVMQNPEKALIDAIHSRNGSCLSLRDLCAFMSIPLFLALFVLLATDGPRGAFESFFLLLALNTLFLSLIPLIVAYVSLRAYLASGHVSLIMLGNGTLTLGFGSLLAGLSPFLGGLPNTIVTVHNMAALGSGLFHLLGAVSALQGSAKQAPIGQRKMYVAVSCLLIPVILMLLLLGALKGLTPVFFIQNVGPTHLRQVILGASIGCFIISAVLLAAVFVISRSPFVSWYGMALALIATGLLCVLVQRSVGSHIGWLGRAAQYLAGGYLLVAVLTAWRDVRGAKTSLVTSAWTFFFNRLELVVAERTQQLVETNQRLALEIMEREKAEKALRESHDELERRVEERTIELRVTNEELLREITDRKKAEEELKASEARVRTELDSILSPEGDIGTLELADVIDTQTIQSLMDDFYRLTKIGVAVIDLKGKVLVATGWQDICTKFHRVHPETRRNCVESDTHLSRGVDEGVFKLYRCKNNMWDIATPIVVGGEHLGNLFLGQFFFEDETLDYEAFRSQARQYGFDEQQYLAALDQAPRWSRQKIDTVMTFYAKLTSILSTLSYSNIKLAQSLAENQRLLNSLRDSEQRYRAVVDNIEVGISLLDSNMKIVEVNKAVKRYSPHVPSACGQFCYEHYNDPPRSEPCSYCPCVLTLHDGEVHEAITETPAGSEIRNYRLVSSPIKDSDGRVQYVIELAEDITERKKAEDALREARDGLELRVRERTAELETAKEAIAAERQRLYDILETMPVMVCLLTPDYHVAFANRSFRKKFGEDNGRRCFEYCFGRTEPCEFCETYRVLETGKPHHWECSGPDGSVIDAYDLPFTDTDGSPLILEMDIDITDRKRAEEGLRESEKRYRQMFQSNRAIKLLIDPESSDILDANQAAAEFYGYELDRLKHLKITDINVLPPEEISQKMSEACSEQKSYFQFRHRLASGEIRYVEVYSTPMDLYGKRVLYSIVHDITDKHRAQEELVRSNADLEKFAYVASHDLQEPLRNVASCLQMLERKYKSELDADADRYIEYAVEGAVRMKALIRDLLAYSRIGAQRKPLELIDCEQVLDQAVKSLRSAIIEAGATVTHGPLPTVLGDASQLLQVLQNLIQNAVKFRRDEPPQIHVSAGKINNDWIFSVKDNGIGIESQYLDRIFVIFQRLHKRSRYDGTGMGLAIVKKVVERHGGRIWAESEPGVGTTFNFTIPEKGPRT